MNITEQLQETRRWEEFKDWYNYYLTTLELCTVGNNVHLGSIDDRNSQNLFNGSENLVNFCFLPFKFQKGIFEEFLEYNRFTLLALDSEGRVEYALAKPLDLGRTYVKSEFFKDLILWHFNN